MSFAGYADSQAQALSAKQTKATGKAKVTKSAPGASGKQTATSSRLYDSAVNSRTILPADTEAPSALPEAPKALPSPESEPSVAPAIEKESTAEALV